MGMDLTDEDYAEVRRLREDTSMGLHDAARIVLKQRLIGQLRETPERTAEILIHVIENLL